MSVKERLEDARILYANGRREGALLSVLVAVAATARKRYPESEMGDGEAFREFVREETGAITGGIQRLYVKCRGKQRSLAYVLYKFVRCKLFHEAGLPDEVVFEPGQALKISVTDECVTFSDRLVDGLCHVVAQAPENADLFGTMGPELLTGG